MKFEKIISDIQQLIGKQLNSIKPGANISINSVDIEKERIFLVDAAGNKKSRPIEELKRIWDAMCSSEVVHVDSVLGGSGSSRNQPETILANLPYVEWLSIAKKKHLRFVGHETHLAGTLKEMDALAVHHLKQKINQSPPRFPTSLFVVNDVKSYAAWIQNLTGISPLVIINGVYSFPQTSGEIWITSITEISSKIHCGLYPVIKTITPPLNSKEIIFANQMFYLASHENQIFLAYIR